MAKLRILVPDTYVKVLDIERSVTGDSFEYDVHDENDARAIPEAVWRSCDALLVWHRVRIDAGIVAMLDNCRLIVRIGVGFDNIDLAACTGRGIPVCNVPNYGTTEVADHALALLLYLARGLGSYEARLRANLVGEYFAENVPVVRRLRGTTFGAVGLGRIGTAVARRASAFDMKVVYYDPLLPEGHELGIGLKRAGSLEELLAASDVVSLHTPLTPETHSLVNAERLAQMKPGAILINIARGKLVDLNAVEAALRSGHLGAAGLDVLPSEPPDVASPLLAAWLSREPWLAGRLALTPHAAFFSEASYVDMRTLAAEVIRDFFLRGKLRNNVNTGWQSNATEREQAGLVMSTS